jgi:hypothetical protein
LLGECMSAPGRSRTCDTRVLPRARRVERLRQPRHQPPNRYRRELLLAPASPSYVRVDVIRQFHERGKDNMVDVLVELEPDDMLRLRVIDVLLQGHHGRRWPNRPI